MAEQQHITVEIDREPPAGAPADPVADLKAQYDELQQQKQREADGRAAAERRAHDEASRRAQAEQTARAALGEAAESRIANIDRGIESAKTEGDAATSEYQAAMEAGDWKKAAEAQRKIARAESNLGRFTEQKTELEVGGRAPPQQQRQPATSGDPVEDFLGRCEPNTQAWLRAHIDDARVLATNSDPRRAAKLMAADNDAKAEGLVAGSSEYFAHVEKFLGMRKEATVDQKDDKQQQQPVAPARRAASAPVAPVAQSGGGMSGASNIVRLSEREARAAIDGTLVWNYNDPSGQNKFKKGDPIGVQEFARRKQAMQEQGQYDKTFVEQ